MWGLTLWLALAATIVLMIRPRLHETSASLSFLLHFALALPFFSLAYLFMANDTSILHVAAFGGADLPLKYRFAATWAAREGPLLMWLGWMALLSWWWRRPFSGEEGSDRGVHELRLRLSHGMSLALLLISFSLDPFKPTPAFFFGNGLNPLLQTDLMVIHPPLIFLTYSMCLHLSAVGLSAAYTQATTALSDRMLAIARPALLTATLGIGLGGLWAYLILDWGGYWAWDPVETGSFLPWLALVAMIHLRTRPGRVSDQVWIGAALLTAFLSIFATTVTRAGGVWASSIHTFVTNDSGTPPSDVFGRLMQLQADSAATEIMVYVTWMFTLIGCWFAVLRSQGTGSSLQKNHAWATGIPVAAGLLGWILLNNEGVWSWTSIPHAVFLGLLFVPLGLSSLTKSSTLSNETQAWSYHGISPAPIHLLASAAVFLLCQDVFITFAFISLFLPLYYASSALDAWPWAAAGVVLGLSLAWSELLSLPVAAFVLFLYVLPWLLAPNQDEESPVSLVEGRTQRRIALWGSVILVSLYLVLTWVLLLASIDAVNFDAHELYGAPFMTGVALCFFLYTRRNDDPKDNLILIGLTLGISTVGFVFFADSFGRDASTLISGSLTRGHIIWVSLPALILALAPMAREVNRTLTKARSKGTMLHIPFGAHIVHFGLLLLLLGHLSTTVLVDRGDASHRLSLVKDEVIIHDGIGYEFTELTLESEGFDVGDGFVGVYITVYEMNEDEVGKKIGEVRPGMLRFDEQGIPRSEVDTLTRLSGDIVFIFDGSQSNALMQTVQSENAEAVDLVRVTVYVLPHSHAVWLGWVMMMGGMALVTLTGSKKASQRINKANGKQAEEE
ncbi:MAG: cytochrome c biogenesis protein CcsA [Candidatus Poseidonia sp.]|nr:cytochrome c biogenesis protein CcsA [Poseidonia sp.]